MARIRDYKVTSIGTATTSPAAVMPTHQSGDLLIAFHATGGNGSAAPVLTPPAGWSLEDSNTWILSGGFVVSKVAASSSETYAPTLSYSEEHAITVVAITGFHATNKIEVIAKRDSSALDNTIPYAGTAITTLSNNALVFQFLSTLGGLAPVCEGNWHTINEAAAGSGCSGGLAYTFQKTAGAISAPEWYSSSAGYTLCTAISVADDGNADDIQAYVQRDVPVGELLETFHSNSSSALGNSFPGSLGIAAVGAKTAVYDAPGNTGPINLNPYWSAVNCTPAQDADGSDVSGPELAFGAAKDFSGGFLVVPWMFNSPGDLLDLSRSDDAGEAGLLLVARDGTAYKAWTIGAQGDATTKSAARNYAVIQVDQSTDTAYASDGTVDETAVDALLMLASSLYGACAWYWKATFFVREFAVAGGSADNPIDFDALNATLNTALRPLTVAHVEGAAATYIAPVTFGGTDPVHVSITNRVFQMRQQANGTDRFDHHVDDDAMGFEFVGAASDTLDFRSDIFVAGSPCYWRLASGFNPASHDFTGATIIGFNVTLQPGSFADMALTNSPTTQNGATIAGFSFTDSPLTCDDLEEISDTTFTSTGTGHALVLDGITAGTYNLDAEFVGYGANGTTNAAIHNPTGNAITIGWDGVGTPPTVYDTNGSTTTISTPVATSNIAVSGMPTAVGAERRLQISNETAKSAAAWEANTDYAAGDMVLRTAGAGTENTAGLYMRCTTGGTSGGTEPTWTTTVDGTTTDNTVTWTTYAILFYDADPASATLADTYIDGEEFAEGEVYGYRFAELNGSTTFKTASGTGLVSATGFSILISTVADSVYALNAVDGSGEDTKFSPNYTDDYIVLDANVNYQGIGAYAYYCYVLTTSRGMYEFWGGVTALDASNYRINTAVVNLYFDETAGFVRQTDTVRIFRDDGARPALDPTTGGNGIEINWFDPTYGYDSGGGGFTSADRAVLEARSSHSASDVVTALKSTAMETGRTWQEQQNINHAVTAGKAVVTNGGLTVAFRDAADTKDRVVATVDANGQRTAVTVDGS